MEHIEDYLELICKQHLDPSQNNNAIYFSIYKQVSREVGLTDRQYDIVLKKIQEYIDVTSLSTKFPLRVIDRSKTITIVSHEEMVGSNPYETYKQSWHWIKVKFPFSKKDIVAIEKIVKQCNHYYHKKGSHEHFFKCTALNAYHVYNELQHRNFNIDNEIKVLHDKTKQILNSKNDYQPVLVNNQVYNLPDDIVAKINGKPIQLQDKALRYGYTIINPITDHSLASLISVREEAEFLASPDKYNLNQIAESFLELDRFPLLVLIEENKAYEQVSAIYNAFSGFIANEQQSVLFRIESNDSENVYLNSFIHQKQLNNWVDKSTKIVYIKKNKLPKVLLKSEFVPTTALSINSDRCNHLLNDWIKFNCDLIVYNDNNFSNFKKWTRW